MSYTTTIIFAGTSLLGACAGLVGCFAVLRRRALVGDALAHAALPGVCLAFLVLGYRSLPAMLLGAFVTGIAGIVCISTLRQFTRIKEDAAIGIVLSVFFGAGVVLLRVIMNSVSAGSKAGLETYIYGKTTSIALADVYLIGGAAVGCLAIIVLLYKEFQVVVFDSEFAGVQGWPAFLLDLLLMAMIAFAVVIGLPAVGVVMMAALLIIPAAAARFWTEQLWVMLAMSALMGAAMGAVGTTFSSRFEGLPAGPAIVLCGSVVFLISLLTAPRRGLLARLWSERKFRRRMARQRTLNVLYNVWERSHPEVLSFAMDDVLRRKSWTFDELHSALGALSREGCVSFQPEGRFAMTDHGLQCAAMAARGFRMWELFLTENAEASSGIADFDYRSLEERLPREMIAELEEKLKEEGRYPTIMRRDGFSHECN
ncbi:MAG: metal ABC transporter permease [Planctomycetaceae bacterium]|jgi:manganese/zinc/iron transport system permease protein|nr:metal ABC transporter permease [Planctomycetaceae bacterium]MBT6483138.1 metal ABC transporter permease [Planctomycetaceae bacterium]MBT6497740.1 metal ABC transporter permease [Planctomycetaceae bacterium]